MTKEKLKELVDAATKRRSILEAEKGQEYTQGNKDRLANFKRMGADILPVLADTALPEQAALVSWMVSFNKHYDGLKSFIKSGKEFSAEGIEGRIDDMQVYLDLCRGLVDELKVAVAKRSKPRPEDSPRARGTHHSPGCVNPSTCNADDCWAQ